MVIYLLYCFMECKQTSSGLDVVAVAVMINYRQKTIKYIPDKHNVFDHISIWVQFFKVTEERRNNHQWRSVDNSTWLPGAVCLRNTLTGPLIGMRAVWLAVCLSLSPLLKHSASQTEVPGPPGLREKQLGLIWPFNDGCCLNKNTVHYFFFSKSPSDIHPTSCVHVN